MFLKFFFIVKQKTSKKNVTPKSHQTNLGFCFVSLSFISLNNLLRSFQILFHSFELESY